MTDSGAGRGSTPGDWPRAVLGRMLPLAMRAAIALMLLAALLGLSALPAATPIACTDGCGEEEEDGDTGCVECPFCASLTAPMVLPTPDGPVAESASPHVPPAVAHRRQTEEKDVFHVPRLLA